MTCRGCGRDVTLLGRYCGHCGSAINRAVNDALDDIDVLDGHVYDLFTHREDGYLHIRIDVQETSP